MFDLNTLEDLNRLAETAELECKLAQGQDGKGEVPKDFWPTYSAMANAHGGVVLLGVREKAGRFSIAGLENPAKLRADLFNTLNNRAKVSVNLLGDADVEEVRIEGKSILVVRIPAATRQQRPVFLNGQPLGHTWRRLNDGDRLCDEATVKRLLAEQLKDSRDTRILDKFGLDDLDLDSLHAYRNAFAVHRPGHPWVRTQGRGAHRRHAGALGAARGAGELPDPCRLFRPGFGLGGEITQRFQLPQSRCDAPACRAGIARRRQRLPQPDAAPDVPADQSGRTGRIGATEDSQRLGAGRAFIALARQLQAVRSDRSGDDLECVQPGGFCRSDRHRFTDKFTDRFVEDRGPHSADAA